MNMEGSCVREENLNIKISVLHSEKNVSSKKILPLLPPEMEIAPPAVLLSIERKKQFRKYWDSPAFVIDITNENAEDIEILP